MFIRDVTRAFFLNSNHIVRQQLTEQQGFQPDRIRRRIDGRYPERIELQAANAENVANILETQRRCLLFGIVCFFVSE
ncbi:unnamed protein product [Toxocara canis]|uniref:DUF4817 domain-containing protein n=1 Tax=Toxocara canis TaxID=6265 RepID=A0A183TXZ9_TOXCA|nr:unnamed protein product [Toxocara canis]